MENTNKYIKILEGYDGNDPMHILYNLGYKPDIIKEAIIQELNPFFNDKAHLEKDAIHLAGIWCGIVVSLNRDANFKNKVFSILKILNEAYNIDKVASMHCIRFWMPSILQSGSRFWSILKSQQHLSELPIEDFLEESLRIIGQCIEGLSKPYLCMLLHLNKIKDGKANADESEKIGKLDLGNIIDELISNANLSNLLVLNLHNLKLHNWRNISYHHNSRIKNGEIIIDFKSKTKQITFNISREELFEISLQVYNIFKSLKLSFDIFVEDHLKVETEWIDDKGNVLIRKEARFNDFRILLSSQGFKIESMNDIDSNTIKMVLIDLGEDLPTKVRAIHSSQFLHALWQFSKKQFLEIEYRTKKGYPVMISSTSSEVCETIHSNEEITKLAGHVRFNILNPTLLEEVDPFNGLSNKISADLHNGKYYSQEQEEIDIETYIYKLTLAIFSDYLVLLDEGALEESVEIKYTNSGCIITGKINHENILMNISAPINSVKLKNVLSDCVDSIINSYKKSVLASKYIIEAKERNMYLHKRSMIKARNAPRSV